MRFSKKDFKVILVSSSFLKRVRLARGSSDVSMTRTLIGPKCAKSSSSCGQYWLHFSISPVNYISSRNFCCYNHNFVCLLGFRICLRLFYFSDSKPFYTTIRKSKLFMKIWHFEYHLKIACLPSGVYVPQVENRREFQTSLEHFIV